jgi:hypothetical protein
MNKISVVTFGLGGHTEYHAPREGYGQCTTSGYERPESFIQRKDLTQYEGVTVIDLRPAVEKNPMLAINAPMLDTKLPYDETDRCPEIPEYMLAGLGGSFKTLAAMKTLKKDFSGLDSVGQSLYVGWWRDAGARVGTIKDGAIEWE